MNINFLSLNCNKIIQILPILGLSFEANLRKLAFFWGDEFISSLMLSDDEHWVIVKYNIYKIIWYIVQYLTKDIFEDILLLLVAIKQNSIKKKLVF